VGDRQRACSAPGCQAKRRKKTQTAWRDAHPDYFTARRIAERCRRAEKEQRPPPPLRVPPPLSRLPWDIAQDEFGVQGADFLGVFGRVLLEAGQDQRTA